MGPHSTADDPSRYRSGEEVAAWEKKDPVRRVATYLERLGLLDEKGAERFAEEARDEVARVVKECEGAPPVPPGSLVADVYSDVPWHLAEQRKWIPHTED
jgi:TPP-dependent pyruvate/acetoin dehydrogenase alpha subunit